MSLIVIFSNGTRISLSLFTITIHLGVILSYSHQCPTNIILFFSICSYTDITHKIRWHHACASFAHILVFLTWHINCPRSKSFSPCRAIVASRRLKIGIATWTQQVVHVSLFCHFVWVIYIFYFQLLLSHTDDCSCVTFSTFFKQLRVNFFICLAFTSTYINNLVGRLYLLARNCWNVWQIL